MIIELVLENILFIGGISEILFSFKSSLIVKLFDAFLVIGS